MPLTTTFTDTGIARLKASEPQALPFAPDIAVRAFLLERAAGDLLVYSNGLLGEVDADRQYLTHWHEAMFGLPEGPRLIHHAAERPHVDGATFDRGFTLEEGDFTAIPIPGHTPGSTAYLWDTGAQRLLFTGDSVYLRDGRWVAAVLDSSDREAYVGSLDRLLAADFDLVVPWAASADGPMLGPADLAPVLERVRRGEDA